MKEKKREMNSSTDFNMKFTPTSWKPNFSLQFSLTLSLIDNEFDMNALCSNSQSPWMLCIVSRKMLVDNNWYLVWQKIFPSPFTYRDYRYWRWFYFFCFFNVLFQYQRIEEKCNRHQISWKSFYLFFCCYFCCCCCQ